MPQAKIGRKLETSVVIYFILPAIILEVLIHLIPMALGISIGFKKVTTSTILDWMNAPFVGLENFKIAFDPARQVAKNYYSSIITTFRYGVSAKILHFALGLIGAILVNRKFKGRTFFRVLFLMPLTIPTFISAISWRFLFLREWGLINTILVDYLHLFAERPSWLVGPNAIWAIIIAQVWRGWSFHYIMILSGLQGIPPEMYEVVDIDGGGPLTKFRVVTFPYLKPVLKVLLVVNGLRIFNEFETAYVMMGARPPSSANVMSIHVYNQAFFNYNFGLASAMAIGWLLVLIVVAVFLVKITNIHMGEDLT
mgnify:CR=1 FL=1